MQLFYAKQLVDGKAILDENESSHCIRVLRKKKGDEISLTDGKGHFFEGRIIQDNPRQTILETRNEIVQVEGHPWNLHIAIAPTKNMDRFEWFVEKAVEIGVNEISPVICHYSERKKLRTDRLERIMVSAMKQSLKAYLPILHPLRPLKDIFDEEISGRENYIAHLEDNNRTELVHLRPESSNYLVLIGPEGDFHPDEILLAKKNNFQAVSLGYSRLRTETAGVAVCQIISDIESLKRRTES